MKDDPHPSRTKPQEAFGWTRATSIHPLSLSPTPSPPPHTMVAAPNFMMVRDKDTERRRRRRRVISHVSLSCSTGRSFRPTPYTLLHPSHPTLHRFPSTLSNYYYYYDYYCCCHYYRYYSDYSDYYSHYSDCYYCYC